MYGLLDFALCGLAGLCVRFGNFLWFNSVFVGMLLWVTLILGLGGCCRVGIFLLSAFVGWFCVAVFCVCWVCYFVCL